MKNNKITINRELLAKAIKRETGINIVKAGRIVDNVINDIVDNIVKGNEVKIRLFGTFQTRQKKERVGRNPKTMETAKIPSRKVVKFKVATKLKKLINDNIKNTIGC